MILNHFLVCFNLTQLQPHFLVKAINPLGINRPTLAAKKNVYTAIAITYPCLRNLPDPLFESGLITAFGLVMIKRCVNQKRATSSPDRHFPIRPHFINKLTLANRPQSFRLRTS